MPFRLPRGCTARPIGRCNLFFFVWRGPVGDALRAVSLVAIFWGLHLVAGGLATQRCSCLERVEQRWTTTALNALCCAWRRNMKTLPSLSSILDAT